MWRLQRESGETMDGQGKEGREREGEGDGGRVKSRESW